MAYFYLADSLVDPNMLTVYVGAVGASGRNAYPDRLDESARPAAGACSIPPFSVAASWNTDVGVNSTSDRTVIESSPQFISKNTLKVSFSRRILVLHCQTRLTLWGGFTRPALVGTPS